MTDRMVVRDENVKGAFIEFQKSPNKRSIIISVESNGGFATVVVDKKSFERAADEMKL